MKTNLCIVLCLAVGGVAYSAGPQAGPKERLSYALGLEVGRNIRKQSLEVAPEVLLQGVKDALAGRTTLMTDEEARLLLFDLQAELKRKQDAAQAERVLAANQAAEKNRKEGEEFLARNKTNPGVATLASGLEYKVLKSGDGKKPALDDTVVCHYRGTLTDGTEFDSSYKRNQPATLPLKKVIKGWAEALQLMPVGSKWQLFIPAHLAYGERGAPRSHIGPNAALIFEVELIGIKGGTRGGEGL